MCPLVKAYIILQVTFGGCILHYILFNYITAKSASSKSQLKHVISPLTIEYDRDRIRIKLRICRWILCHKHHYLHDGYDILITER